MTARRGSGILAASIFLGLLPAAALPAVAASPRAAQPLFNGANLDGFSTWLVDTRGQDPRRVFSVTNGMLRISGDGLGYLATTNEHRDYKLVVEFMWGTANTRWGGRIGKARDSGIFLHATGPDGNSHDGNGAFMAAIECNLFQGATGDFLLIRGTNSNGTLLAPQLTCHGSDQRDADGFRWFFPGGKPHTLDHWGRVNWLDKTASWRDEFDFRGPKDVERPPGEWNRLEATCDGAKIRIELNGQLVNEAFDVFPSAGKILFQCEGSEIFFRRIELQPLSPTLKP